MKRSLYFTCGLVFCGLGFLGSVLPLLPTTPFLLLSAFFFSRSSDRMHQWLITNKVFGPYITNYQKYRGMTLRSKIISVSMIWISILSSIVWGNPPFWVKVLLGIIALSLTIFLCRLNTIRENVCIPQNEEDL